MGSGNGMAPNRRRAFIWTNVEPVHCSYLEIIETTHTECVSTNPPVQKAVCEKNTWKTLDSLYKSRGHWLDTCTYPLQNESRLQKTLTKTAQAICYVYVALEKALAQNSSVFSFGKAAQHWLHACSPG